MKRSRLRRVSDDRAEWNARYKKQHESDPDHVICAVTGNRVPKWKMQRHHVARRLGRRILIYCYVTPAFHEWIENNSALARQHGWLRNEGEGYPKNPDQPRPWFKGSLINEHMLDD